MEGNSQVGGGVVVLILRYYPGKTALLEVQIEHLLVTNQKHYCWRELIQYLVLLLLYLLQWHLPSIS